VISGWEAKALLVTGLTPQGVLLLFAKQSISVPAIHTIGCGHAELHELIRAGECFLDAICTKKQVQSMLGVTKTLACHNTEYIH
jgi:hypothetical protein